jgi:uncharacterized metal-binding protein
LDEDAKKRLKKAYKLYHTFIITSRKKNRQKGKICDAASKYIFSCSRAADVGHISDLAARKLTKMGTGNMFCLAGIGAMWNP